eukprot:CAMPEP_0117515566 /NCGR_PEP_ID=MMETSP0784-20121206/30646_1 /TAXON_ID=39447 /ORGANISM="" /LENGTH=171 /DNA_ID=CAMNT_0005311387 /DNA_START=196 /DNA_END=711 /DNA_ORIENTATION=+
MSRPGFPSTLAVIMAFCRTFFAGVGPRAWCVRTAASPTVGKPVFAVPSPGIIPSMCPSRFVAAWEGLAELPTVVRFTGARPQEDILGIAEPRDTFVASLNALQPVGAAARMPCIVLLWPIPGSWRLVTTPAAFENSFLLCGSMHDQVQGENQQCTNIGSATLPGAPSDCSD